MTAGGVASMYAPPAMTLWHLEHFQMPTHVRFTLREVQSRRRRWWSRHDGQAARRAAEPYRMVMHAKEGWEL